MERLFYDVHRDEQARHIAGVAMEGG